MYELTVALYCLQVLARLSKTDRGVRRPRHTTVHGPTTG